YSKFPKPYNIHAFGCGIDPVSQRDVLDIDEMSKSALVIKRKFDPTYDGDKFNEDGTPVNFGEEFLTNRYACAYLYRHEDPNDNYDDWLKAIIYFGTDFLIEKNKGEGFYQYLEARGFTGFYMDMTGKIKNYRGQSESYGLSASDKTIEYYFSLLRT